MSRPTRKAAGRKASATAGSNERPTSTPPPAHLPKIRHLEPILNGPNATLIKAPGTEVPSIQVDFLLRDFFTEERAMDDLDIILVLTSNDSLPLLRAFEEELKGNNELRKEVDTLLLGEDYGAEDTLEKFAALAQEFAEKVPQYERGPVKFASTYSSNQAFLAQSILRFLNGNSAEGKFFKSTVADFLPREDKLAFVVRVFTHFRLDIRGKGSDGFYGTLLTKIISRPMDSLIRAKWVKLYWLPGRRGGIFKATYEPTCDAHGRYMFLKAQRLRETENSRWEKEDRPPVPIVSVDGKVMSEDETKKKQEELVQEYRDKFVQFMGDLEASDNLFEQDLTLMEKCARVEAKILPGVEILDSRNVTTYDPNDPFTQKSEPVKDSEVTTRFDYFNDMQPFDDEEHRIFAKAYRALNDPQAKHDGKKKTEETEDEQMGPNHWKHIADLLPGRTVREVIRHHYNTKGSEDRGRYKEGLPKKPERKPYRSSRRFEPLTGNLTTDKSRNHLHYQLVKATNRMQAFELVQRQNKMAQMQIEMEEKDEYIPLLEKVADAAESLNLENHNQGKLISSLSSDLVKSQQQLKKAQSDSIESQRLLHETHVEKMSLEKQLKTAGDGMIRSTLKNISKDKEIKVLIRRLQDQFNVKDA